MSLIWLRHADPSKRLDTRLADAVEPQIHKILTFRRNRFGDEIAAIEAIEDVVRSASTRAASIKNPQWYIFASSLRRLKRTVKHSPVIHYVPPASLEALAFSNPGEELDSKILCQEIRAHLGESDFVFLMRVVTKDCTWERLGAEMGLSADAARKKYDRLILHLRERLL